jgi:hypothetical protein
MAALSDELGSIEALAHHRGSLLLWRVPQMSEFHKQGSMGLRLHIIHHLTDSEELKKRLKNSFAVTGPLPSSKIGMWFGRKWGKRTPPNP